MKKFLLIAAVGALLAGCGGGSGSHTYVFTMNSPFAAGIYVTVETPSAIPQSYLTKVVNSKGSVTMVDHTAGPLMCSKTMTVKAGSNTPANMIGKTVTVKINGSNPFIGMICAALAKKQDTAATASKPQTQTVKGFTLSCRNDVATLSGIPKATTGLRLTYINSAGSHPGVWIKDPSAWQGGIYTAPIVASSPPYTSVSVALQEWPNGAQTPHRVNIAAQVCN